MASVSSEQEIDALLQSLNLSLPSTIAVDKAKLFPKTSGMGWKGDMKRRLKFLNNCEGQLQKTLKEGEVVQYITLGIQQKFLEQYFLGIWAQFINQTVFVFTNVRILAFNSNSKGKPKHQFWSIYYNEVDSFKSFLGTVTLKLKDKSKYKYSGFKGVDKKAIPEVVNQAMSEYQEMGFSPTSTQSRETLCSQCVEVVPPKTYQCANCQQEFFTPKQLAIRSLIFPSWGDFSMKHTMLAVVELLGYLVSLVIFGILIAAAIRDGNLVGIGVFVFLLLCVEHVFDAGLTYFLAKKGLNPKK